MKKAKLVSAIALALAATSANAILFDPDGAGPLPAVEIAGFDYTFNTFFGDNAVTAITAFQTSSGTCPNNSCNFTVYTQASVANFTDAQGNVIPYDGLNSTFEITMVGSFTETVNGITTAGDQTIATFRSQNTPTNVEFYYDAGAPDSNPLTGFGYNDGTLILNGTTITQANGSFSVNLVDGQPVIELLDQSSDGNQYGDQNTVTGQGITGNINLGGLTYDPTRFLTTLASLGLRFTNISQNLPFTSTNPGDCFNASADRNTIGGVFASTCDDVHVNGNYAMNQVVPVGAIAPLTGNPNGLTGQGPDFVAQTDFNSTFIAAPVPEPASLALLGIGLAALGFTTRRRKG